MCHLGEEVCRIAEISRAVSWSACYEVLGLRQRRTLLTQQDVLRMASFLPQDLPFCF